MDDSNSIAIKDVPDSVSIQVRCKNCKHHLSDWKNFALYVFFPKFFVFIHTKQLDYTKYQMDEAEKVYCANCDKQIGYLTENGNEVTEEIIQEDLEYVKVINGCAVQIWCTPIFIEGEDYSKDEDGLKIRRYDIELYFFHEVLRKNIVVIDTGKKLINSVSSA